MLRRYREHCKSIVKSEAGINCNENDDWINEVISDRYFRTEDLLGDDNQRKKALSWVDMVWFV